MRPLIITGTQRAGTAYIASLITACGYWCSHERFFRENVQYEPWDSTIESSWAAVPYLDDLNHVEADLKSVLVVHQVRHPLRVISSCLTRSTFKDKMRPSAKWAVQQKAGILLKGEDEMMRVIRFWYEWNLAIEKYAFLRWRIEDLTAEQVAGALITSGRPISLDRVRRAMEFIPTTINREVRHVKQLNWDDLPKDPMVERVKEMAQRYGYR